MRNKNLFLFLELKPNVKVSSIQKVVMDAMTSRLNNANVDANGVTVDVKNAELNSDFRTVALRVSGFGCDLIDVEVIKHALMSSGKVNKVVEKVAFQINVKDSKLSSFKGLIERTQQYKNMYPKIDVRRNQAKSTVTLMLPMYADSGLSIMDRWKTEFKRDFDCIGSIEILV